MDEATVSKPYSPLTETRSQFNNPKLSDVRFLVDGQTLYGHKFILSIGSPVFERMFFGDLKEKRDVIEIGDLSLVGFKNILRYIYGFEIDFELTELYESYMAADKYLLHHFNEAFFEYIRRRLDAENSCLIYDQLIKIQVEEISLADVRTMIIERSKETFESEHFTQIDGETLIGLLSLNELSIEEFDLLAAVSKWIDREVQREGLAVNRENRRKVFEPVKGYIVFAALTPEKIAHSKEIAELFTPEEIGLLFLYLLNKEHPLTIELKTSRKAGIYAYTYSRSDCSVFVSDSFSGAGHLYSRSVFLSVNRKVGIRTIYSTYSGSAGKLSLKVEGSDGLDLGLKMEKLFKNGKWCFSFDPPFDLDPGSRYMLVFTDEGEVESEDHLSPQLQLSKGLVIFDLIPNLGYHYHCVRGLDFFFH